VRLERARSDAEISSTITVRELGVIGGHEGNRRTPSSVEGKMKTYKTPPLAGDGRTTDYAGGSCRHCGGQEEPNPRERPKKRKFDSRSDTGDVPTNSSQLWLKPPYSSCDSV